MRSGTFPCKPKRTLPAKRNCLMPHASRPAILGAWVALAFRAPAGAEGDLARGAQAARACMACHSFAPGRHMTGPSLANV